MSIPFKEKTIKYLSKDFQSFKRDLMQFTEAHQSGAFQDENETSPGMAMLEQSAYIGDVLAFYQDMQFEELRQAAARELGTVVDFAKVRGYRPSGKRPARGNLTAFIEVPATFEDGQRVPDDTYSPVLLRGSQIPGPNGVTFETLTDVIFSASAPTENTDFPRMVTGSQFDPSSGLPTHFALRKEVEIIAGTTKTDVFEIDVFQQFRTVELVDLDVIEVISVTDSDGNDWTEVDFLAQETVFDSVPNEIDDSGVVPYVLKLKPVPRRFIVDRDPVSGKTSICFGNGDGVNFDDELIPNVADFALPLNGKRTFTSFAIDPQNFLKTRTLGLSPFNTTLTVTYRTGGGLQTNVAAGSLRAFGGANLEFASTLLDPSKKGDVESSIECVNVDPTAGGAPEESISEIKANAAAYFAAQARSVTREDYLARLFAMPAKFGKVEKAFVRKSSTSQLSLDIHVLAKDQSGNLAQATPTLVRNIKTLLSQARMLTDGVNILRTDVINLTVDFGVVISPKFNRNEVLGKCLSTLRDALAVDNMQLGQPVILSELESLLQNVVGVVSVYNVAVKNIYGLNRGIDYSTVRYDVQANTQNGIVYCPETAVFEILVPERDIRGEPR